MAQRSAKTRAVLWFIGTVVVLLLMATALLVIELVWWPLLGLGRNQSIVGLVFTVASTLVLAVVIRGRRLWGEVWDEICGWSKWGPLSQMATALGVMIAIITAIASYTQGVENTRVNLRRQANITAMQMIEEHHRFAAERGMGLIGAQSTSPTSSEGESNTSPNRHSTEQLVAQHGLLTANRAFDLTEETLEHNEMKAIARLLLEQYEEDIERIGFPCSALDDEFVRDFARKEVDVNPCRGPVLEDS